MEDWYQDFMATMNESFEYFQERRWFKGIGKCAKAMYIMTSDLDSVFLRITVVVILAMAIGGMAAVLFPLYILLNAVFGAYNVAMSCARKIKSMI